MMTEGMRLCVHCGEEIRIIPDNSGRLLKCDVVKTLIITEAGDLVRGYHHHSMTCSRKLEAGKAVNDGGS
jgi:hypothetical protein